MGSGGEAACAGCLPPVCSLLWFPRVLPQVVFHDVGVLTDKLFPVVEAMQKHFSAGSGTYYSDSIFFLSVAMHQIMPKGNLDRRAVALGFDFCVFFPWLQCFSNLREKGSAEARGRGREAQPHPLCNRASCTETQGQGPARSRGQREWCGAVSPDSGRASGLQACLSLHTHPPLGLRSLICKMAGWTRESSIQICDPLLSSFYLY